MSLHVVLVYPEIPANTGNIIRLAANTGAALHLVHPLGYALDDKRLRRAGLDYHEYARIQQHENLEAMFRAFAGRRLFAATAEGTLRYDTVRYQDGDVFVFGCESTGLPAEARRRIPQQIYIPMLPNNRSLNLSNAVAVITTEAWRQQNFPGTV